MAETGTSRPAHEDGGVLERACARNVPVELHRRNSDGLQPVMRARLIALDDANLYLDSPQTIGLNACVEDDEQLVGYFDLGENMFTFDTTVVHALCNIRLNAEKTVPGLSVTRPAAVQTGQRRSFFRRCVAAERPIEVSVHVTDPSQPDSCPVDALRVAGTLVDASEGGFGVNIPHDPRRPVKLWDQIFVRFQLPGLETETELLCEVRQIRALPRLGLVRLGLMALPWPDHRYLNLMTRPVAKYLVDLERKSRNVRGAA
jgi:hypothetical protein